MGDGADLMFEAMETGESWVWFPDREELLLVDNVDLMYATSYPGIILENCSQEQLKQIAKKYKIRAKRNLYSKILETVDP